jgi:hypothetical protein
MTKEWIYKFSSPYTFEGKEYKEIDFSAVPQFTVRELIRAEKLYMSGGNMPMLSECAFEFACALGHVATGLPMEFFISMPTPDGIAIKNTFSGFFYGRG